MESVIELHERTLTDTTLAKEMTSLMNTLMYIGETEIAYGNENVRGSRESIRSRLERR